jgi:hypothetical protein
MAHPAKLTDTHLVLLSAASQREDNLLSPARLRGGVTVHVARNLLAAGVVEEVVVLHDELRWRDDPGRGCIGLKVTRAGLAAIAVMEPPLGAEIEEAHANQPTDTIAGPSELAPVALVSARRGAKRALVLSLLQREEGAALNEVVEATGWLPHSARAALTGLRHDGVMIERTKTPDGRSLYRVAAYAAGEI